MTVSSSVNKVIYSGNSATVLFPVNYYFLENSHLKVILRAADGTETVQALTTNYTVTGAGNPAGGSVTMLFAPPTGTTLTIVRNVPATQETDYLANDPFPAESHERALDKLTMLVQESEEIGSRSIQIPQTDPTTTNIILPAANSRASRLMGFSSNGSVSVSGSTVAQVDAAVAAINTIASAPSGNSASISHIAAGASAVATTVQAKLRETVSVKDFGVVGDGVADDTTALQAALNACGSNAVLDGLNLNCRITSGLTYSGSNITIKNLTLDMSDVTTIPLYGISFEGTKGTDVSLTADIAARTTIVTVGSTATFSAGQYAYLSSSKIYDPYTNSRYGQIVQIKTVDSATQLTLFSPVLYAFETTNSAKIAPLNFVDRIKLDNFAVTGIGGITPLQGGLYFKYCKDVLITGSYFYNLPYTGVRFDTCYGVKVESSSFKKMEAIGLAYGVAIVDACFDVTVQNCSFEDLRHGPATGGREGVNLFIKYLGNNVINATDSGLDCHPNTDYTVMSDNTIKLAAGVDKEGIIYQGKNLVCTNNILYSDRFGVRVQSLTNNEGHTVVVSNNQTFTTNIVTGTGIIVQTEALATANINGLTISGNTLDGSCLRHINVAANTANIFNVAITGNVAVNRAVAVSCHIRPDNGASIARVSVTGNTFKSNTSDAIWFYVPTFGVEAIEDAALLGNNLSSTSGYCILARSTTNLIERGNNKNGLEPKINVVNDATVQLDNDDGVQANVTTSTYNISDNIDTTRIINSYTLGTLTLSLPNAARVPNRQIYIRNAIAQAVESSSSNIVPTNSSVATTTAILPAVDGAWAILRSNGTSWHTLAVG